MIICCNTRFIILEKKSKSEKKFFAVPQGSLNLLFKVI